MVRWGDTSLPIWMELVDCRYRSYYYNYGFNRNTLPDQLANCLFGQYSHSQWGAHDCTHLEDVTVLCGTNLASSWPSPTLDLSTGSGNNASSFPLAPSPLTTPAVWTSPTTTPAVWSSPSPNVYGSPYETEGSVRLTGGAGPWEGRLEIYHDNQWGTVCDDGWSEANTMTVCRQLGYNGTE
jgi:hypothetical protein